MRGDKIRYRSTSTVHNNPAELGRETGYVDVYVDVTMYIPPYASLYVEVGGLSVLS